MEAGNTTEICFHGRDERRKPLPSCMPRVLYILLASLSRGHIPGADVAVNDVMTTASAVFLVLQMVGPHINLTSARQARHRASKRQVMLQRPQSFGAEGPGNAINLRRAVPEVA